ncbi:hypothetical protein Barb6XT_03032 [Bacteroidales bacterium Barb6XT]|nr:hypothetical protein Barb6XT_03032 [Bacteroidales bacterium Barb6XT]
MFEKMNNRTDIEIINKKRGGQNNGYKKNEKNTAFYYFQKDG